MTSNSLSNAAATSTTPLNVLTSTPSSADTLSYADIQSIVANDFEIMDKQVFGSLNSKVQLVMSVSQHVINAGGKRMRPLITLLCARMFSDEPSQQAMHLAAITEMLHTATLVHDDVIDESGQRRGKPTANATWDNATAVLVGDYLIACAFNLLVGFQSLPLLQVFSDGTCDIAEGEVLQLQHQHNPAATEQDYLNIIDGKTSRLFMMATQGAAILQNKTEHLQALADFGQHFGNAFQIVDDVLDYSGDSEVMGKNLGDDLREGKATLPLIAAMERGTPQQAAVIRSAIEQGSTEELAKIIEIVQQTGALEIARSAATQEANRAIDAIRLLPATEFAAAMRVLANQLTDRRT